MGQLLNDNSVWAYAYAAGYGITEPSSPYTVEPSTLNHLLRAEIILDVLMRHGVHQWAGFDEAMSTAQMELDAQEEE